MAEPKKKGVSIRIMIVCAVFAAIGFILDRFLGITLPLFGVKSLSINMSYIPIFLAGFFFGPIWGALVGGVQDILCCIFVPMGPFMPGITVTTMLAGALGGFFKWIVLDREKASSDNKKSSIAAIISAVSAIAYAVLCFIPIISNGESEGKITLSAWEMLVETANYKTVFCDVLKLFEGKEAAEYAYIAQKIGNTAALISSGFAIGLLLTVFSLIMTVRKQKIQAVISVCVSFVITGIMSATAALYIPKALKDTGSLLTVSIVPYLFVIVSAIALFAVLTSFAKNVLKIAVFCLITTVITSVLNSFWISLAYTSVSFWVYLIPRLASALFISVPLYTVILHLIMKRFGVVNGIPTIKK